LDCLHVLKRDQGSVRVDFADLLEQSKKLTAHVGVDIVTLERAPEQIDELTRKMVAKTTQPADVARTKAYVVCSDWAAFGSSWACGILLWCAQLRLCEVQRKLPTHATTSPLHCSLGITCWLRGALTRRVSNDA
jgi:hypothetical protein